MLFSLKENTTYINSGNSFSRAFLLGENFKDGKNLLVFDTQKEAEAFSKTLSFITNISVYSVFDIPHMMDFFHRGNDWFITTKEFFEVAINWKYHMGKYTFLVERNMDMSPEKCITNLIDFGYTHSAYLSKSGTYKKDGDTISIRLLFEEKVIALSFFDTIIDEILVFDTHGQFITKKEEISLPTL
jgi:hypothetical protein